MNPRMLTVARESRGYTQLQLAKLTSIPQGSLSKAENGQVELSEERMSQMATVLRYPRHLFDWPDDVYGFGSAMYHHRKQQSISQAILRRAQAMVNLLLARLRRLTDGIDVQAPFKMPTLDLDDFGSPEEVARATRAAWLVPMGPIQSMTGLVEAAGAVVVRRDLGSPKIAAVSIRSPDGRILFVLNLGMPSDRERFTLGHEAGHLIMHDVPRPAAEHEADRFAAELLMPAAEIRPQLTKVDLAKAATLKQHWRTSMGSIIRRARDLGTIPEVRYRSLRVQMSQRGFHRHEPVDLPHEEPAVVPTMVRIHLQTHGYSIGQLAQAVALYEDEFQADFHLPTQQQGLRLVR